MTPKDSVGKPVEPNKCKYGLAHAWQEIENNIVYPTNPPRFPPRERFCLNCSRREVLRLKQPEIKEWELK